MLDPIANHHASAKEKHMELLAAVCAAGTAGVIALTAIANMLALAMDLDSN